MTKPIDLTGQKFGRLTVISEARMPEFAKNGWYCRCECGSFRVNTASCLNRGIVKSCGCFRKENNRIAACGKKTHGATVNGEIIYEYKAWQSMKARVLHSERYKHLEISSRWISSYENFLADMGDAPSNKHQVDRIDNSKGYYPDNCRWATPTENQRNRTNNKIIEWMGVSMCVTEWEEKLNPLLGLKEGSLKMRLNKLGWTVEKAFTTPSARITSICLG